MNNKYKAIIGIEMHCEVSETKSKVFSNSINSYEEKPNVNINAIDLGFPGILPIVNKEAVRKITKKLPNYVNIWYNKRSTS